MDPSLRTTVPALCDATEGPRSNPDEAEVGSTLEFELKVTKGRNDSEYRDKLSL